MVTKTQKDTLTVIDYDALFVFVDDFSKGFEPWYHQQLIQDLTRKRRRQGYLKLSEVITILLRSFSLLSTAVEFKELILGAEILR